MKWEENIFCFWSLFFVIKSEKVNLASENKNKIEEKWKLKKKSIKRKMKKSRNYENNRLICFVSKIVEFVETNWIFTESYVVHTDTQRQAFQIHTIWPIELE